MSSLRIIKDDGTVLNAVLKEKETALEQYSDGISSGMSAFVGNVKEDFGIEMNLGNLPPDTGVKIEVDEMFKLDFINSSWIIDLYEWVTSTPHLPSYNIYPRTPYDQSRYDINSRTSYMPLSYNIHPLMSPPLPFLFLESI